MMFPVYAKLQELWFGGQSKAVARRGLNGYVEDIMMSSGGRGEMVRYL